VALAALLSIATAAALAALWGFAGSTSPAQAQYGGGPPNDDLAAAASVSGLPFSDVVDNTTATTEPGEPQPCSSSPHTVWYTFTPSADEVVRADMNGSNFFDTNLRVYQSNGPGFGGLTFLGCQGFGNPLTIKVQAGQTYAFQAGDIFTGGGSLHFNLDVLSAPGNDNFTNAKAINSLPFDDNVDATAATTETGEPLTSAKCSGATPPTATVWYAFTPSADESLSASFGGFISIARVYTGSSLSGLTEVACSNFSSQLTFHASSGTTYFFQLAPVNPIGGGQISFHLDLSPNPVAGFFFFPFDPSVFDTVTFGDQSFDPAGVGIQSEAWTLGDGATATGCCPTHRYMLDGDYTAKLTVTTFDGRSASNSQVVHVKTHDVAITQFTAPKTGRAGRTESLTVQVSNARYPEDVQVQLFKGTPAGFQQFGSLTLFVPVKKVRQTTAFKFSYTFTNDDAAIGKVTFKASASIVGFRDALTGDNDAIAPPTKVSP
jgi:hypothetical protein